MAIDSMESLESVSGFDPADSNYRPQSEYRAYRNVISFIDTLPDNTGTPLSAVSKWPIVTQQLNTATTTEVSIGYDPFRQYVNQAFVTSTGDGTWDPVWTVIHGQPLSSGTPIKAYVINTLAAAQYGSTYFIGKGCFLPNLKPEGLPYNNTGSVVVMRYAFPMTDKATGFYTIRQLTVTRSGGPYASNMASDFTWTVSWQDISTSSIQFAFPGTPRRRIEAISCTSNGTFIALVTRNNPEISGTGQFLPHTEMMFYKVTGCQWFDSAGAASGTASTATWTPLSPVWSFPITDADYNNTGPVYNMEWMSYCFSAPYDGPGIIYNNGISAKPGLGWTVTVFNGDSYGRALYFLEKDGFCSDIKQLIPTYNAGQTDFVVGMGSTSFIPTGLVQMSTRRDTEVSGLYLSGEFVRTADDGISTSISCYMIGNSLLSNVNSLGSGAFTGNFGWSFGARNFFIDSSGGKACLPLPSNSKFSLEFDYEPTGLGVGWPTITDQNTLSVSTNAYESQRATLLAFSVTGKIFKADLTNSRFHNPPFFPADEIVEWTVNRQSGAGTTLQMQVQRYALSDRAGRPSLLAQHTSLSGVDLVATALTLSTGSFGNSERMFPVGSYFQIDVPTSNTTTTYLDSNVEVFKVLSRSWAANVITITVERGSQGTPIQSHSSSYGVWIVPFYPRFESGNMIDIRYWADGSDQATVGHPSAKIGGFMIDDIEYETRSGLKGLVTVHGMDVASSLMGSWSSPIDMFFDPKSVLPLGDSKKVDGVPTLKHLIQKTPGYPVDVDGLNGYESWDKDAGYKHWGINRPAIFYNAQTEVGGNPLNKHRIRFSSNVDTDVGIQAFGSIIAGYDDGTMAAAFIGPATKRMIWASSADSRTSGASSNASAMDTGVKSLRKQDGTANKNRVNILGSKLQTTGDYQGFTLAPGGRQLIGVNGSFSLVFVNVTLDTTNVSMTSSATTFTITGNHASNYTASDLIQLQDSGCTTSATVLDTSKEVMTVVSASYSSPNTTVTVTRAARGTTATSHLTTLVIKRIVPVSYTAKQLETIFGSSNDSWDGYQRIAGGGGYKIDADLTIAKDTDYDYAVKQFGRNILVYYKASAYGAGALGPATNVYILATHYLAESNRDAWMRPGKKKYGGFAVSTDAWYKQSTEWKETELGIASSSFTKISFGAAAPADRRWTIWNEGGASIVNVSGGGGGTVTVPSSLGGTLPFWGESIGFGAVLYPGSGYSHNDRAYWYRSGNRYVTIGSISSSWADPSLYENQSTITFVPNVLFRLTTLSTLSQLYSAELGIPFRTGDANNGTTIVGNTGYFIVGDEVMRWKERTDTVWGGGKYEYSIHVPVDVVQLSSGYVDLGGSYKLYENYDPYSVSNGLGKKNWTDLSYVWKGWNGSGTAGMGSGARITPLQPKVGTAGDDDFLIAGYGTDALGWGFSTEYWTFPYTLLNSQPLFSDGDVGVVWPRGQLGTRYTPHAPTEFISSYPAASAAANGFPATTPITESIQVKRNTSFHGPYRSVADSIFQTTALAGARTVFQENYAALTGSFVDTLPTSNATYTTSSWSLTIRPNTYASSSADFKGLMLRFRNSDYYLKITAADWSQTSGTKALTMTLYWRDSANDDILEKVEVPLFGHLNATLLTAPIRISLSSDTLSVDVLDEQIWSFDLASYSDGNGSTYYSAAAGTLEIKNDTTTGSNVECWWHLSELGDEVEATVVDRGSDFSSALSFLLNGRWVKSNPTSNGYLLSSRFLGRYSPYDLSTGIMRTQYTLSVANSESPGMQAGHVESSGGTFGEVLNASWIRANGYMFKEQQNRLILTPSDARLESKLKLREERENSEKFSLSGHLLPSLQADNGIPWTSSSPDYVVEAHTLSFRIAQAMSNVSCRKYYAL